MKIRVLHLYKSSVIDSFGGIEKMIDELSQSMDPERFEVRVFALSKNQAGIFKRKHVTYFLNQSDFEVQSNPFSLDAIFKIRAHIDWADILHFHSPFPTFEALSLFYSKKISVTTYHSDIIRQRFLYLFYKPINQLFMRRQVRVIATSKNYIESSTHLKSLGGKVDWIPLGINLNDYLKPSDVLISKFKKKYGDDFFLYLGVLRAYKSIKNLIAAVLGTNIKVVIAGQGPELQTLKALAKDSPNIKFISEVSDSDKKALLYLARAFMFPSSMRSEAFGYALLEAQAFKKPIVSCDIKTGTSYVNVDGLTGLEVAPNNVMELKHAMLKIDSDSTLQKSLGENGRVRVEALFTLDKMALDYDRLYRNLYRNINEVKARSVLFVANSAWNLAHFRLNLINMYLKDGYKVYLAGKSDHSVRLFPSGVEFINIDFMEKLYNPFFQLKLIWKLGEILKKNKINHIFSFTPQANILAGFAQRFFYKNASFMPNISGLGESYINRVLFSRLIMMLYKIALKNTRHIFFQNHDDKVLFANYRITDRIKYSVLPGSGVDLVKFKSKPISESKPKKITFIFLGRLIKTKGITEYISAAERVHQIYPNVQFNIMGNFSPNKNDFNQKDLDFALEINNQLSYLGYQSSIIEFIYRADCVVLPSYREGRPRALMEALACGRPVITSDVPGCREVVVKNKTGYLVKHASVDDLVEKMIKFIELSAKEKTAFGKNAANHAKKTFDIKFIDQAYSNFLTF